MGAALKGPWDADEEVNASAAPWDHDQEVGTEVDDPGAFTRNVAQALPLGFGNQLMAAETVAKGRLGRAAAAGLSGGVSGALDALAAPGVVDEYRQARDEFVDQQEAASASDPFGALAGKLVGAIPSMVVPGGGSLKAAMAGGAAVGGANALAESKADLTRGEVGEAAKDTFGGAAFGAAGGAAGYGLGKLASAAGRYISGKAAPRVASATSEIDRLAAEQGGEEVASLAGKLGGEVQKGSRMAEFLGMPANKAALTAEEAARLQGLEGGGQMDALRRRVAGSHMDRLPGQVGAIDAAQAALQQAQENLPARVAELAANIGNPMGQVMPRLQRYLPPVLGDLVGGGVGQSAAGALARGVAGAGVGYMAGGDTKGAVVGALAGAGMRPAFQSILRGVRHPSVQRAVWSAVQQLATKSAGFLGRYGPMLGRLAATNLDDAFTLHQSLMAHNPDYAEKVARALESAAATEQVEPTPEGL